MNWLIENKEWLFSGIGVVFVCWVVGKIFKKGKEKDDRENINIVAGNVSFAKNHGKSTQIINSKVGVVGDHAEIKGDVNVK